MCFVYVLHSQKYDKIYIGMTSNLESRLFAHNNLPSGWTKNYRPWKLIHSEQFAEKSDALKRENELKSHQGRNYIRNILLGQQ